MVWVRYRYGVVKYGVHGYSSRIVWVWYGHGMGMVWYGYDMGMVWYGYDMSMGISVSTGVVLVWYGMVWYGYSIGMVPH